jgi:hypothetical protein
MLFFVSNVSSIRTNLKAIIIAVSFLINSLFPLLGIVKNEKDITSNVMRLSKGLLSRYKLENYTRNIL